MRMDLITFRSITPAQRGQRILQAAGIGCTLQRTPKLLAQQGCGYCLRLREEMLDEALRQLRDGSIQFRKIYLQHPEGSVEEVTR